MKNRKKFLFIIILIVSFCFFLHPNHTEISFINFNNNFTESVKIKSFLYSSEFAQINTISKFNYLKNSLENIINKENSVPEIEPDFIIIYTFINSLYYLIKFKINLWGYNKLLFFENSNKIKPYFNINFKNKIINVGVNVNF